MQEGKEEKEEGKEVTDEEHQEQKEEQDRKEEKDKKRRRWGRRRTLVMLQDSTACCSRGSGYCASIIMFTVRVQTRAGFCSVVGHRISTYMHTHISLPTWPAPVAQGAIEDGKIRGLEDRKT